MHIPMMELQIDEFESATRRYPIYECLYNQEKICLCPAPVGSAAAVQVLEYLIAGGVTKIISVGSCGVLEDIPENRFLIPVSALRDEGTSYHYLPPSREVEISKAGINAIESALSQKNIPYWEVKTWTTDGFLSRNSRNGSVSERRGMSSSRNGMFRIGGVCKI